MNDSMDEVWQMRRELTAMVGLRHQRAMVSQLAGCDSTSPTSGTDDAMISIFHSWCWLRSLLPAYRLPTAFMTTVMLPGGDETPEVTEEVPLEGKLLWML